MSVTTSTPAQINASPLNLSPAKHMFSFSRADRFKSTTISR